MKSGVHPEIKNVLAKLQDFVFSLGHYWDSSKENPRTEPKIVLYIKTV